MTTRDEQFLAAIQGIQENQRSMQSALVELLQSRNAEGGEPNLSAPRKTDEFLFESVFNVITEFTYNLENDSTFENWFSRFEELFSNEKKLDDNAKVRLLLLKLDTSAHKTYVNYILPDKQTDYTFVQTVATLKEIFGRQETEFSRRYDCLNTTKRDDMDILTYYNLINKSCEKFDITNVTVEQFKCLMFVMGLKSSTEKDIRARLLMKLDADAAVTLKTLLAEYRRIVNVKHDTSIEDAKTNNSILVNKVSSKKSKKSFQRSSEPCSNCGEQHESKDLCPAKDKTCNYCKKRGHLVIACRKRKQKSNQESFDKSNKSIEAHAKTTTSKGKSNTLPKVTSVSIHQIDINRKFIDIQINSKPAKLQIDSAADISIISHSLCSNLNLPYSTTTITPNCASGQQINLIGEIICDITFRDQTCQTTIYVSDIDGLNIFGIDLFNKFNLWKTPIDSFCNNQILNVQQKDDYATILKSNFPSCFETSLGKCKMYKANLRLKENVSLPFCKYRPVPFSIQSTIETELKRLQSIGIISAVTKANCATPIVVKQKKNGSIRICGDFSTGLNDALHDHHHPLPLPEDIFAKLNGSTIFSHIDLSDAFLQIEVDDKSSELLIINTHVGLFKYNRLTFGIKTAPTIFQEIMDKMIAGLRGVVCYMDDIFVCGSTKQIHDENLILLMKRLKDFGFHIKILKSRFALTEIKYLGCIVNKNGIQPDPHRIEAINNMPEPTNLTELRSFLGTVNFYCKFIIGMHRLRAPLDILLRKDVAWQWTKTEQNAFNQLKKALTSELLLTHYNPRLDIIISADASNKGLGASIQHRMSDNSIKPIAYAARSLKDAERNYSQIEKEGLALIFAINKFHKYVFGRKFTLKTDHKPLLAIFGGKKGIPVHTANRLQRWAVNLLAYDFNIEYVNTDSFAYVDSLSRLINQNTTVDEEYVIASINFEHQLFQIVNKTLDTIPVKYDKLKIAYNDDAVMQQLIKCISSDWKNFDSTSESFPELRRFFNRKDLLSITNEIVLLGDRVVIPSSLRENIVKQLHKGHPGMDRMKNLARMHVYWPNIDDQIENFVKLCKKCALHGKSPTKTLLHSWPTPSKPWERLHIDYAGPFKNTNFLIVIDAYSKWPEIIETKTTTSSKTIEILTSIFARFGAPLQLVSDNGTQFTSVEFQLFCNVNGIEHIRTSPYHPMSNGQAERFVDTFKRAMKKLEGEGNLKEILQIFLMSYRSTPNKNCKQNESPAEMLLGRKIRTTLDLLKPTKIIFSDPNVQMEDQFNRKHGSKHREFVIGEKVFVQVHSSNTWHWEEGEILDKIGIVNYVVRTKYKQIRAHTNQIKKRYDEDKLPLNEPSFGTFLDMFDDIVASEHSGNMMPLPAMPQQTQIDESETVTPSQPQIEDSEPEVFILTRLLDMLHI